MSTVTTSSVGPRPTEVPGTGPRSGPGRRSVPHLLLGVLLVCSCTAGAVVWSLNVGERRAALALARSVTVGQTLAAADLREVSVAVDGDVDAIPASEASSVVGRLVAADLPAGVLLSHRLLGAAPAPAVGRAVAAIALQPGQAPLDVQPGAHVLVVLAADPNAEATTTRPLSEWPGIVADIARDVNADRLVVSVDLDKNDARSVAAAPVGRLSVVVVAGGDL